MKTPTSNRAIQPSATKTPKPETKCLCCGEPTKGGKFLPGHDARYVSQQAVEYVDAVSDSVRKHIYNYCEEHLSNHLFAKFVKRIESVRTERAKKAAKTIEENDNE